MKKSLFRILLAVMLCVLLCACTCAAETETDWYMERADMLLNDLAQLSADREYLSLYSGSDELINFALRWSEELSGEPLGSGRYYMPTDLVRLGVAVSGTTLSDTALKYMNRSADNFILAASTASQGVNFLAASSMLRIGEGFIMPEDFKPCIVLYEYESLCVAVLFTQTGEGVVTANAAICSDAIKQYCISVDAAEGTLIENGSVGGALMQDSVIRPGRTSPSRAESKPGK